MAQKAQYVRLPLLTDFLSMPSNSNHIKILRLPFVGLLYLLFFLFTTSAKAQFYLNDRYAAYDSLTQTYLFTIDESLLTSDSYNAVITFDSDKIWNKVIIDGVAVTTGDTVSFNLAESKDYSFTASISNSENISAQISFTCMPIISLQGDFGYDYSQGTVSLYMPYTPDDDEDDYCDMLAKLKWRGATTNADDKHKRNYHIKFLKEDGTKKNRQFFGLRKDNDWILDANQVDMARCRNRIATDLWNDVFAEPYYIKNEPEALSGTRGRMVEVFLNNEYRGIYAFTENVDGKQMCLVDYDDYLFIHHGHLWKATGFSNATMMISATDFDDSLEECNGFETKHPDFDDVSPTDYSILSNAVRFVGESSDDQFTDSISVYFDLPVLVDYFIFLNITIAIDNGSKNLFYACYDEQLSTMLTLAVWDLDCTFGQHYTNKDAYYRIPTLGPETDYMANWCGNMLFRRLYSFDWFNSMVNDRYLALRHAGLTAESIAERFDSTIKLYLTCGAASREVLRWSGDTDISGRNLDFEDELEYIDDWIERRITYLDTQFTTSNITNIMDYPITDDRIYNICGQCVGTSATNLPKGIYIQNGRKFCIGF